MLRLSLTLVALLGLAASPALAVTPQFGVGAQYDKTHVYIAPSSDRRAAMVESPGGYIAEIHATAAK
ncbi:hypothetical protein [Rhizobium vallis]|uniref:hypothetical protein n=1 Tax=Rhizobium vallis TaxID=634290 RepID=UPI001FE201F5|nr:hypothetical protein [Rhizobium vallis]